MPWRTLTVSEGTWAVEALFEALEAAYSDAAFFDAERC